MQRTIVCGEGTYRLSTSGLQYPPDDPLSSLGSVNKSRRQIGVRMIQFFCVPADTVALQRKFSLLLDPGGSESSI